MFCMTKILLEGRYKTMHKCDNKYFSYIGERIQSFMWKDDFVRENAFTGRRPSLSITLYTFGVWIWFTFRMRHISFIYVIPRLVIIRFG